MLPAIAPNEEPTVKWSSVGRCASDRTMGKASRAVRPRSTVMVSGVPAAPSSMTTGASVKANGAKVPYWALTSQPSASGLAVGP